MRTSYSSIETYLQCPQKYKFQEIDKLRMPKSREAIFGTLVHSSLKFMFQRDPLFPTLDEVVAHFREHWPVREKSNEETVHDFLKQPWSEEEEKIYFEEGVRMLKKFYEKNAPWNFSIVDLESRFEVVLEDEKTGIFHVLAGVIDRIDKISDGKYEIIDYKTSKRMPSQEALNNNLQLSLYSLGLQKRWPHLQEDDIRLSLYFLKHGEKLSTKPTHDNTIKTKAHVLRSIREIEKRRQEGKEFEPMPGPLCNWCSFRPLCPAWRHLYRKTMQDVEKSPEEMQKTIAEYLTTKKTIDQQEKRLGELQTQIKDYMNREGLTRLFNEEGIITKKKIQRFNYDLVKVKEILMPLGRWEELLKADETRLKKIMKEIPENIRVSIEELRSCVREYIVMTASLKPLSKIERAALISQQQTLSEM